MTISPSLATEAELYVKYLQVLWLKTLRKMLTVIVWKLSKIKKLSVSEYEKMFFEEIIVDEEGNCSFEPDESLFSLEKIENHKRIYKKNCK